MPIQLEKLKADLKKEAEGVWIDYPDWGSDVKFLVRSLYVTSYTIKRDQLIQKWQRTYKGKTIPPLVKAAAFGKLYAEEILRGWEGIEPAYTPEVALETLQDPAYREIVSAVEWCATQVGEVNVDATEEDGKNSELSSASV